MNKSYKKGEVVIAVGATVDKDGVKKIHRQLVTVMYEGKYDCFVVKEDKGAYDYPFRISKKRCQKIQSNILNPISECKNAKIGDLVLSITQTLGKIENKIGTVEEIIVNPSGYKLVKLRHSNKTFSVGYDSIIVLEE